jgi:hypothetical protein
MIPLEKPYINLFVHKDTCYNSILEIGEEKYLQDNSEKVHSYIRKKFKSDNSGKKQKKSW